MFNNNKEQPFYSPIQNVTDLHFLSLSPVNQTRRRLRPAVAIFVTVLVSASTLFAFLQLRHLRIDRKITERETILFVPVSGIVKQHIVRMPSMEFAPPADGSHEPAWDQLIPNGLGYVKHPDAAPEISVISVFHQLHCLYTIRRAYFAAHASSTGLGFNTTGIRSPEHVGHCFDYLQQSLTCMADAGIEPLQAADFHHTNIYRQCRDFQQVKDWAEKWRVLNGQGFLADVAIHNSAT